MPPILHVSQPWPAWVAGAGRQPLATEALAPCLAAQRWFPAKTRTVSAVAVEEAVALEADGRAWLLVVSVGYADGGRHRFAMPVGLATGEAAARVASTAPARVIAELTGEVSGVLHDDMAEHLGSALLDVMARRASLAGGDGTLVGECTAAFERLRGPDPSLTARRVTAEQSNTSVIFGDHLIMKVIRRLEPGLNPDYEIGRHLTDVVRFPGVPALAGALLWHTADADPVVVAILQAFVPGATVLRERLVARLADVMRAAAAGASDLHPDASDTFVEAQALGRRTGALHLALADARGDAGFAPERVTAATLREIAGDMRHHASAALDLLAESAGGLPPSVSGDVTAVLSRRRELIAAVARVADVAPGLTRIRVHGDYQLDQVLVAGGEFVILDFEGEPLRPLAERRAKFLALKDVAGMLRSFSYAAYAALFQVAGEDGGVQERLDPLARRWAREAGRALVAGYRQAVGRAAFVPASDADFDSLLAAFVVEKATYELRYELSHRPAWLRIPLRGLAGILDESAT